MRPTLSINPLVLLLAAALGLASAASAGRQGSGDSRDLRDERPDQGLTGGEGIRLSPEGVAQKLARIEEKWAQLQTQFTVQNSQQTAPIVQSIQSQLSKAREYLSAGNYPAADMACRIVDTHIGEMASILNSNSLSQFRNGPSGSGKDPERAKEDMKNGAQIDIQRNDAKLADFSQLLALSKNPRAGETLDRTRSLLDRARQELAADRPTGARLYLAQVEPLFFELQRLVQELHSSETQQTQDGSRDAYKDLQPGAREALGRATEVYRRVQDRATRTKEQSRSSDNPKAAAAGVRVQELLDKAKEALGAGQAEAAKEYALKAEGLLAELHRSVSAGDARLSPAAWQRLKAKLERASEIVAASRNDKAAKILEKGKEHFERAQRNHAEGQASRAEVEMDLALKLAAKSVDIARAGSR